MQATCNIRKKSLNSLLSGGFTLLEVLLAMAILMVLVAGLAGIASVSLRIGRDVLDAQAEESVRDAFERLLRENLSQIPMNSPVLLDEATTGAGQTLIFGQAAGMFPISGIPLVTQSVALETRRNRAGQYGLWILYYAGDLVRAKQDDSVDEELMVQIPFREGFQIMEWSVYDPVADEWLTEWENEGRRPHYLALDYQFSDEAYPQRMVVWLPKLQTNAGDVGEGDAGGANNIEGDTQPIENGQNGGQGGTNPGSGIPRPPGGGSGRPSIEINRPRN